MKKKIVLTLATLMLVIPLSACGSKNNSLTTPDSPETEDVSTKEDAAKEARDGALKLVLSINDGSSKDDQIPYPWLNRTMATNLMYRSLFLADSTLTSVEPDLAESYTISDDGLIYTITLKDGLKWSDGQKLTVDDVIFSINAALNTAVINSIYTSAFSKIEDIYGDGNTLTMKLSQPYSSMINILAQFAILPEHCLEQADLLTLESDKFWKNPVTSGMYTLDELNAGSYFTLKLNNYYEGTIPQIEKVTVSYVKDYLEAAQSGISDYIYGNGSDFVEGMEALDNFTSKQVDVLFYKYFIFNFKGIDGKENPAMANVAVRSAIIEAIDRAALANLYSSATVLNSGVPDSWDSYNGFSYTYNVEKAKEDIINSGYDTKRPFRICYYNNDRTSVDLINMVVDYLEQAGLTVEVTFSNDGTADLFTTREYDMGFKGKSAFSVDEWYSEYISIDSMFANIWGGDDTFDEAVNELSSATDEAARNAALKKLQALEQENMYKVPMFTVGTYVFLSDDVILPDGVEFCNPLYMCDLDYENWKLK